MPIAIVIVVLAGGGGIAAVLMNRTSPQGAPPAVDGIVAPRGKPSSGPLPDDVFERFRVSIGSRDWDALWGQTAPSQRRELEQKWVKSKQLMSRPDRKTALRILASMLEIPEEKILRMTAKEFFDAAMIMNMNKPSSQLADLAHSRILEKRAEGDHGEFKVQGKLHTQTVKAIYEQGRWSIDGFVPKPPASSEED